MRSVLADRPGVQYPRRPELAALAAYMRTQGYHQHAVEHAIAYVEEEGTLEGLIDRGLLEPADYDDAEAAYVGAMPPVCGCSPAWDEWGHDPDDIPVYLDLDSILEAARRPLGSTEDVEPFRPGDFPREKTADEHRRDLAEWVDDLNRTEG